MNENESLVKRIISTFKCFRSRQLTAMGKEGLYLEDHEDQMSLHRPDHEDMTYNQVSRASSVCQNFKTYFQTGTHQHHPSHYLHKYKESSRFDRLRGAHQSDDVYQNGSYLGNQNNSNREASRHASCRV